MCTKPQRRKWLEELEKRVADLESMFKNPAILALFRGIAKANAEGRDVIDVKKAGVFGVKGCPPTIAAFQAENLLNARISLIPLLELPDVKWTDDELAAMATLLQEKEYLRPSEKRQLELRGYMASLFRDPGQEWTEEELAAMARLIRRNLSGWKQNCPVCGHYESRKEEE